MQYNAEVESKLVYFSTHYKTCVARIRYAGKASGHLLLQVIIKSNQQNSISQAPAIFSPYFRTNTLTTVQSGVLFLTEDQNTECSIIQFQKDCQSRQ